MAPSSKWAWAKPTLNPIPIMPTMWLALTLLPKIEPATPHQGVLRPARKKSSEVSSLRLAHRPMAMTTTRDPKKTIRSGVVRTFSDNGGHRSWVELAAYRVHSSFSGTASMRLSPKGKRSSPA